MNGVNNFFKFVICWRIVWCIFVEIGILYRLCFFFWWFVEFFFVFLRLIDLWVFCFVICWLMFFLIWLILNYRIRLSIWLWICLLIVKKFFDLFIIFMCRWNWVIWMSMNCELFFFICCLRFWFLLLSIKMKLFLWLWWWLMVCWVFWLICFIMIRLKSWGDLGWSVLRCVVWLIVVIIWIVVWCWWLRWYGWCFIMWWKKMLIVYCWFFI